MAFFAQTGPSSSGLLAERLGSSLGQGIGQGIAGQRQLKQNKGHLSELVQSLDRAGGDPNKLYSELINSGIPSDMALPFIKDATQASYKQNLEKQKMQNEQEYLRNILSKNNEKEFSQDKYVNEKSEIDNSVQTEGGFSLDQSQIDQMILSPHENIRRYGEAQQKKLDDKQKRQYLENSEIRKETRAKINEFSKPYNDISLLKSKVNNLSQVKDLIKNDDASFDDSFWRTTLSSLLEDDGKFTISELFKNPAQQKMYSLLRPFFGTKEIGGSNPSTREVLLSLSTLPSSLKKKEANEFIVKSLMNEAETALEKSKIINSIDSGNLTWKEFQDKINNEILPFQEQKYKELVDLTHFQRAKKLVENKTPRRGYKFVLDPEGKVREIKMDQVKDAVKAKGKILSGK